MHSGCGVPRRLGRALNYTVQMVDTIRFLVLLALLSPASALADDEPTSVDAATEAEEVLSQHCSDVASAE